MKRRLASTSFLLFLVVLLVYVANGRAIGAGDTLPARYLPFSILRGHSFNLDEFPFLYGEEARRAAVLDGIPYFLRYRDGHYLSAYSPAPAILALPVYVAPVLVGVSAEVWAPGLEKLSGAAITALSVVFLFWALTGLVSRGWALGIAAIYAFGTSSWSVSSQALWQHGPSQLFLALLLVCLVRGMKDERFLAYAGFAMSAATVMRSTDLFMVLPVAAYVVYTRPRLALRLALFALPPIAGLLLYNIVYFGSLVGGEGNTTAPAWAFFAQVPLFEGLPGLLVSPSRGLFVYSPVLLLSVVGLLWVGFRGPVLLRSLVVGVVAVLLVVSKWFLWWGGHSWGPRLLADTTPILCFFLYPLTVFLDRHRLMKGVFVVLVALSVGAHGLGAFFYDGHWEGLANVGRSDASLWSWGRGPLVFYGREAASVTRRVLSGTTGGRPTSADSPTLLAASYTVTPIAPEAFIGEPLAVSVKATNTGRAVWLASVRLAPDGRGAVRLGWRWSRDNVDVAGGRVFLSSDVFPGRVARFAARIPPPPVPGDYTLTIDLVSELMTWFADQGQNPVRIAVRVRPADPEHFLSKPVGTVGSSPAVTISTDRASYRRGDTLHLTVNLRNPDQPSQFDAYLARRGPDGAVWFYDGNQPPRPAVGSWVAWARQFAMPARATGRFALPLSTLVPGVYHWHVVLTEPGTYRPLAKSTTTFSVEP